jgi:hypothetical protein
MSKHDESITPRGRHQECLEHSLAMAHIIEHAMMFLPKDCELWHRSAVELSQYGRWINRELKPWN